MVQHGGEMSDSQKWEIRLPTYGIPLLLYLDTIIGDAYFISLQELMKGILGAFFWLTFESHVPLA